VEADELSALPRLNDELGQELRIAFREFGAIKIFLDETAAGLPHVRRLLRIFGETQDGRG
jgi:hypothetical protein